jgi:hypothetical protein
MIVWIKGKECLAEEVTVIEEMIDKENIRSNRNINNNHNNSNRRFIE